MTVLPSVAVVPLVPELSLATVESPVAVVPLVTELPLVAVELSVTGLPLAAVERLVVEPLVTELPLATVESPVALEPLSKVLPGRGDGVVRSAQAGFAEGLAPLGFLNGRASATMPGGAR
ncbi:hypothetical protein [Amycolatopsis jejuensis]|uniref:hypothetical protein n=1 Tax=Amycolatopsis jejuensis TaxID=330084 RepID=UPI00052434F1|nr:hypothetical protein [Amycolatopsis jejuensis]